MPTDVPNTANDKASIARIEAEHALLQSKRAQKNAEAAMSEAGLAYQAIRALKNVAPSTHNDRKTLEKAEHALQEARQALERGEEAPEEAEAARVRVELARSEAVEAKERAEHAQALSETLRNATESAPRNAKFERQHIKEIGKLTEDALTKAESALQEATQIKDEALTAQVKAQQAEIRYHLIILASNDGIWDWNIQENTLFWNGRFFQMLGYKEEEVPPNGMELWEALHPEDKQALYLTVKNALAHNMHFEQDFRMRNKAGQYINFSARGQTLLDENDHPIRMTGMIADITERKESEEAIQGYQTKLEQSNKDLEQFASIAAYDLQEPLRKIRIFSEYFIQDTEKILNSQSLDDLTRMLRSIISMQNLIDDLLTFSKVTQQSTLMHIEPIDLNDLFDKVQKELNDQISEKKAHLEIGKLDIVKGDSEQLEQLFSNLLQNALKFVRVGVTPHIAVSSKIVGGQCEIQVTDNGIGFDESDAERIFGIFERLHSKKVYPGTGLGLTICRRIAESHNGTITAKSKPGKGSTFIIKLPV